VLSNPPEVAVNLAAVTFPLFTMLAEEIFVTFSVVVFNVPMLPVTVDTSLPRNDDTDNAPTFPVNVDILFPRNDDTDALLTEILGPNTNVLPINVFAVTVPGTVKFPLELSQ